MDLDTDVDLLDRAALGPMTEDAFLDWVVRQDRRYEFDGEFPIPMVGNFPRHGLIAINVTTALRTRLRGTVHRVLGSDTFIRAEARLRVPDACVVGRDVQNDGRVLADPVVVFEIVSAGSGRTDRIEKAREYWATPSIRHYAILEQDFPGAEVLTRGGEGWVRVAVGAGESIALPAIGIELPMDEVYEDLDYEGPNSPDPQPT